MGVSDAAETPQREAGATTAASVTADAGLGEDVAVKDNEGDSETTPTARTSSDDTGAPITAEKSDAAASVAAVGAVPLDGAPEAGEVQYITGWKLISAMCSLTLAMFLVLLDMSILATVRPF